MTEENPNNIEMMIPQVWDAMHPAHIELADAVDAVCESVCERHVPELRAKVRSAASLDDKAALDDLPDVLVSVGKALRDEGGLEPLALLGPAHAAARHGQGFTLEEVFAEYVLLRRSLRESLVDHLGRLLSDGEKEALQSAIDALVSFTLVSFTAQREAASRLENTALSQFLTSLAHDLRNEINGVMTTLHLLDETGREVRQILNESAIADAGSSARARLDELLADVRMSRDTMDSTVSAMTRLLQAERVRNRVKLRPRDVSLQPLLHGIARSGARVARKPGDENPQAGVDRIKVKCAPDLTISTDPDLLGTVLINVVGNAVKHAPQGPIELSAVVSPEGACRIEVRDHGPGIPAERLETLFEKFDRGERSGTSGLGLGLYIARRAAELLGGRIGVQSEVGRGSRFIVELPAQPPGTDNPSVSHA